MKNLLTLILLFFSIVSYGQSIDLYEKNPKTQKKQINKKNHTKIKGLKRFKVKLDDTLEVEATEFVLPDFIVTEGNKKVNVKKPKHFKIKKGNNEGVITLSDEGVLGNIGDLNITDEGLKEQIKGQERVLETDEPELPPGYQTPNLNLNETSIPQTGEISTSEAVSLNGKVAEILYVVDFDMYNNFGKNTQNITNFVANIQAAKLVYYNRIGINNVIKEVKILTDTSAYYKLTTSSQALMQFTTDYATRTDVDLKHLLTNKNYGGIAYIGQIGRGKSYNTAVSGVYNNLTITNDYGWTVYVVSHEEGHSYGSRHTQWCGWPLSNGRIGRIDSCYSGESYGSYTCGSTIKSPTLGGTIMSYCHLNGTLKLSRGFDFRCADVMVKTLNISTVPGTGDPSCTSWTYSAWGPCINGYQTRNATGTPSGCNSFPPQTLIQACSTATTLPVVTTTSITSLTTNSVSTGGNVTSDGGTSVTSRGVVWSTSQNPTISLVTKTSNGSGVGSFVSSVTGLTSNTTYYLRAYATNVNGTSYGSQVTFKTLSTPTTPNIWKCTGKTYAGDTALVRDGDTTTRWVTTGTSRIQCTLPVARLIPSINVWSGFLSGSTWGSPILNLQVFLDGIQIFSTTSGKVRMNIPINKTGKVIEFRGNDLQYNRWREIRVN